MGVMCVLAGLVDSLLDLRAAGIEEAAVVVMGAAATALSLPLLRCEEVNGEVDVAEKGPRREDELWLPTGSESL